MRKIEYKEIKRLNFKEELCNDQVHEDIYGYPYKIFKLKLTNRISIYWDQPTRECELIKIDKKSTGNVILRVEIQSLNELEILIEIFKS